MAKTNSVVHRLVLCAVAACVYWATSAGKIAFLYVYTLNAWKWQLSQEALLSTTGNVENYVAERNADQLVANPIAVAFWVVAFLAYFLQSFSRSSRTRPLGFLELLAVLSLAVALHLTEIGAFYACLVSATLFGLVFVTRLRKPAAKRARADGTVQGEG